MDLSKAFDNLQQDLLIVKLHAYGFQQDALKLLYGYFTKRWHRTKFNMFFSSRKELIKGVPQGSVLGSLFLNIYLNDLFYLADSTEVCNFADDIKISCLWQWPKHLIMKLEHDVLLTIEWFEYNNIKLEGQISSSSCSTKVWKSLRWMGEDKFGEFKTKITWNGNRQKSEFGWLCVFVM